MCCCFPYCGHFDCGETEFQSRFDLHFPFFWSFVLLFKKMSVWPVCLSTGWLFKFLNSLHILDARPSVDSWKGLSAMLPAVSSLQHRSVCCDLICQLWLLPPELSESYSDSYFFHVYHACFEGLPLYFLRKAFDPF